MDRFRRHLSFANVVSLVALFVALGGTAMAAVIITSNSQVAMNTISGHHPPSGKHPNIIGGSIRGSDVQNHSLTSKQIKMSSILPAVFQSKTSNAVDLSSTAGTFDTVVTLSPPAGSYIVTASAAVVNQGAGGDIIRCGITTDSNTPTQIFAASVNPGGDPLVQTTTPVTAMTVSGGTTIALRCEHDGPQSGEYVDPGATIVAIATKAAA
jgi:hypothetical protein